MFCFFFFNDTATTEIYTLSLHDALPIFGDVNGDGLVTQIFGNPVVLDQPTVSLLPGGRQQARSEEHTSELSHSQISYAVFCLKKKTRPCGCRPTVCTPLTTRFSRPSPRT